MDARPVNYWMAVCLRNGSRIEAAAIRTHSKLLPRIPLEFRERLLSARADELRHAAIEDSLSDQLWPSPDILKGVGGDQLGWLGSSEDVIWNLTVLNLVERSFRWRMTAFARRARSLGYRNVYDGMSLVASEEAPHITLVVDLFRAGERPTDRMIRNVAQSISTIERGDNAMFGEAPKALGLQPHDGLIIRAGDALVDDLSH